MSDFFSTLSCITMIAALSFYFRQVVVGASTPNPTTWFTTMVVGIMNTVTYFHVVGGDVQKFLMTAIVACGASLIFLYSLRKGKLTRLGGVDRMCLVSAFVVGVFWQTTGNDIATNLLLQVIMLISIIPTLSGLLFGKAREKPLAWVLSALAHLFLALAVVTDWNDGSWVSMVYPVVNGFFGRGSVAFLAYIQKGRNSDS